MSGFIQVSGDGHGFIDSATGERFVPMGCNYFDPATQWPFRTWGMYDHDRVAAQFAQIAGAGLNCVRVFLDLTLSPAPGQYNEQQFAKVDDMVSLAAEHGLRIIFSGPNHNEGTPAHRQGDRFADDRQLDYCCELWTRIAERWGNDPAVMTWDLMNEPQVGWRLPVSEARLTKWKSFAKRKLGVTVQDAPASIPGETSRQVYRAYVRFLDELGENWVARQCEAIRATSAKNLITVGLVQWSTPIYLAKWAGYAAVNPRRIAKHLDYMSQHFYPILKSLEECTGPAREAGLEPEYAYQKAYCRIVGRAAYVPGKPLVMEEFGWKGGTRLPNETTTWPQEHQTYWCDTLLQVTQDVATGWLNWAFADSPAPNTDISAASGLWTSDCKQLKHWGRRFVERASHLKKNPPRYKPADRTIELDLADYLYEHGGHPTHDWLIGHFAEQSDESVAVTFVDG